MSTNPNLNPEPLDGRSSSPPTPIEWLMRPDMTRTPKPVPKQKADLHCMADLPDRPQEWLWPGRIPRGAITLLCGDAGRGKSLVSLDVAARVSSGLPWPGGGQAAQPGDVLLLSAEDSIGRTVRNRLVANGADLSRVHYLNSGLWLPAGEPLPEPTERSSIVACTTFGDVPHRAFHAMNHDAYQLRAALQALPDCRLVVIDPMPAYLNFADVDRIEDARLCLAPLVTFADYAGAAVIAVVHRDQSMRGPANRRQHPLRALVDMARAVYLIDRAPDDPRRHLMLPVKNNLGDSSAGFAFEVVDGANGAARIAWSSEPVALTDEFSGPSNPEDRRRPRHSELDRAVAWVQGALANGPIPSQQLLAQAQTAGISERCFNRARARLGVIATNERKIGGRWMSALPGIEQHDRRGCQNSDLAASAMSASSAASQNPEDSVCH